MAFEKLKAHAAKLGYGHLSLEFCMEMRPVAEEFAQFMEGMRQLVGPPDPAPFSVSDGCADDIEVLHRHFDVDELILTPENEPDGEGNGWADCSEAEATAWSVWEPGEDGERLFQGSLAEAQAFIDEYSVPVVGNTSICEITGTDNVHVLDADGLRVLENVSRTVADKFIAKNKE